MIRVALIALLLPFNAVAQVPEPQGYRMDEYRSPVPDTLAGATVISADEAHELWESKQATFIDTLPQPPKPANLPEGTIWRDKKRLSIPGAIWLPNTGYGDLAPETETYLKGGLKAATNGDKTRSVAFFCLADCWMSWNAAKRAIGYGYSNVYWMPAGTDGWVGEGYPVEEVKPAPGHP